MFASQSSEQPSAIDVIHSVINQKEKLEKIKNILKTMDYSDEKVNNILELIKEAPQHCQKARNLLENLNELYEKNTNGNQQHQSLVEFANAFGWLLRELADLMSLLSEKEYSQARAAIKTNIKSFCESAKELKEKFKEVADNPRRHS